MNYIPRNNKAICIALVYTAVTGGGGGAIFFLFLSVAAVNCPSTSHKSQLHPQVPQLSLSPLSLRQSANSTLRVDIWLLWLCLQPHTPHLMKSH